MERVLTTATCQRFPTSDC